METYQKLQSGHCGRAVMVACTSAQLSDIRRTVQVRVRRKVAGVLRKHRSSYPTHDRKSVGSNPTDDILLLLCTTDDILLHSRLRREEAPVTLLLAAARPLLQSCCALAHSPSACPCVRSPICMHFGARIRALAAIIPTQTLTLEASRPTLGTTGARALRARAHAKAAPHRPETKSGAHKRSDATRCNWETGRAARVLPMLPRVRKTTQKPAPPIALPQRPPDAGARALRARA